MYWREGGGGSWKEVDVQARMVKGVMEGG